MADVFISFRTDDTQRVQAVHDAFRARGLTVFWSNDIAKGAPNYRTRIIEEIGRAPVVVVLWTHNSVESQPVAQECEQAARDGKLFQVVLDDIAPIRFPMGAGYLAQKTMLVGWTGDRLHREWVKLNDAIDMRLGRRPGAVPVDVGTRARSERRYFLPGAGKTEWFKDHEHGPQMVVVPAGEFMMGSPEREGERSAFEGGPQHKVTIAAPFAVSRFAVTLAEWDVAVSEGGVEHMPDDGGWGRGRQPVINVSWEDAKAYAAWLSQKTGKAYRLLSEAEWEYCCRAGTTTQYAFGDTITQQQAQFLAKQTVEVGRFPANAWGLHDTHGNVWEWCEDNWHADYTGAPQDGAVWQGGDASLRVVRGGSWYGDLLRSAGRVRMRPVVRDDNMGFRVARTLD